MCEVNEGGKRWGEDGKAEVFGHESGEVRKERGIDGVFDTGDVEAAVFREGVVAVDE
jgi:hypothetical protein